MPTRTVYTRSRWRWKAARLVAGALLVGSLILAFPAAAAESGSRDAEALFEGKVRPLLVAKCQECHGARIAEAGLRLDSRKAILLGSDAGAVVVPGDSGKSKLLAAVKHVDDLAMPPEAKLSDEEIATLEAWVAAGVPWTGPGGDDAGPATREEAMQERLRESLAAHWAFQPPQRHPTPDLSTVASLDPAVEKLLASREHAEHWARHWLDLARYADTMGYAFAGQSPLYPFAWTYRDWVVKSLHDDLPYDKFVTLQLAADRIEPPVPREDLAALGFLTVGRTFLGNTHDIIDDRIDLVTRGLLGLTVACARCHDHKYEPISTTDYYALHGVFASCEIPGELPVIGDPPPGPEAEAFATKLAELQAKVAEHEAAVHERAVREAVAHAADYFYETARPAPRPDGRPPQLTDSYELEQLLIDRLNRLIEKSKADHPIIGIWVAVKALADEQVAAALESVIAASAEAGPLNPLVAAEFASAKPTTLRQVAEVYGRLVARVAPEAAGGPAAKPDDPAELAALRTLLGVEATPLIVPRSEAMRVAKRSENEEHRKRQQAITKHQAESPGGPPRAMVLTDKPKPVDSHVFLRGNPGRPGPKTERRLPELLGGTSLDRGSSGRLDLARAIVSPTNPLAARVIVNWAWTHHFGRGLVATPGDLGLRGDPPVNQQLLDDLARRFMDDGQWSLRWLHREIVLSRTWRQSAAMRPDLAAHDPDNRLFGRAERRRLSWEAWRDSLLAAAGTLDLGRSGGPGIDPLDTKTMNARTIYSRLDRQDVPGLLRTFDIANPDTAVHVRSRTTVPQQGLAVFNAPLVVEAAKKLAARAAAEVGDETADDLRITALWRDALSRSPTDTERSLAHTWLAEARAEPVVEGFGPWERLAQALLGTAEFQFID
jgi:mono/diheme cytochrome c family protein